MKIEKVIYIILVIVIVIGIVIAIGFNNSKQEDANAKYKIVSTNFASYDFLKAIVGDDKDVKLTFLMGPGKDGHSYDPTAQDLITIQNADLFVYVGGEMEKWTEKIIETLELKNTKIICVADYVDIINEQEIDGAEPEHHDEATEHEEDEHNHEHEEGAFDEHIWTSPSNAIKMISTLEREMEEINKEKAEKYKDNADNYILQIKDIDSKIQQVVDNKVRSRLIFADKMPMQYFINYYNLEVSAAFSGCSTETEPSASTIAYLEKKVKDENIPVILYIELNDGRVAKTIANETGATAMQIQTLHNISLDDFNNGETWVSLMSRNLEVLTKALQ